MSVGFPVQSLPLINSSLSFTEMKQTKNVIVLKTTKSSQECSRRRKRKSKQRRRKRRGGEGKFIDRKPFLFRHPFTMIVSGPSSGGKTFFLKEMFPPEEPPSYLSHRREVAIACTTRRFSLEPVRRVYSFVATSPLKRKSCHRSSDPIRSW
jgi:hypothetical protein